MQRDNPTLLHLTGQESGIVVYLDDDGQPDSAEVLNWSSLDGLPSWLGVIGPIGLHPVPRMRRAAWRRLPAGLRAAVHAACRTRHRETGDPHPLGRSIGVYVSDACVVVAPRAWN
jgi:hypothetical protein